MTLFGVQSDALKDSQSNWHAEPSERNFQSSYQCYLVLWLAGHPVCVLILMECWKRGKAHTTYCICTNFLPYNIRFSLNNIQWSSVISIHIFYDFFKQKWQPLCRTIKRFKRRKLFQKSRQSKKQKLIYWISIEPDSSVNWLYQDKCWQKVN